MTKLIIPFFVLFFSFSLFSQTTIKGTAKKAEGKTIRLIGFKDLFSFQRETIASCKVDENGGFELEVDVDEPTFTLLSIDYQQKELYLEPNKSYEVEVKYDADAPLLAIMSPPDFSFEFLNADSNNLNLMIRGFNIMFNTFVVDYYVPLYQTRNKGVVDTIVHLTEQKYDSIQDPFFRDYVDYKIAMIELSVRSKSETTIAEEYFIKKPILYNNIEYTELFKTLFYKYLLAKSKDVSFDDLKTIINERVNYQDLIKLLSKDRLLQKDIRILELVLIDNLRDIYSEAGIEKEKVIKILRQAGAQAYTEHNRNYANHLISYLRKLETGTRVPIFTLPDFDNHEVNLLDFMRHKVFLNFWSSDCIPCIEELDSIAEYRKHNPNNVKFVSISTDQDPNDAAKIIREKGYDWTLLYYNNDIEILERYDVRTNFINYFLDEELKILRKPGRYPDESLKAVIDWIVSKDSKE